MARIEEPRKRSIVIKVMFWMIRRMLGKVPMPFRIKAHRPKLLMAHARTEQAFLKSKAVPEVTKILVQLRTSTLVGCPH
jgi:hypothetical protein